MKTVEQLSFPGEEKKINSVVFSGNQGFTGDFDIGKLREAVLDCIDRGGRIFYCGMAQGFDLAAAECVLELKPSHPFLKLIACVPCPDQEKSFSAGDKDRYARILGACDEKILLSEKYYKGCMIRRNQYMADRADALVAYNRKSTGGTVYTLKYFKKKNGLIVEI